MSRTHVALLRLFAEGYGYTEASEILHYSPGRLRFFAREAYRHLGARNRHHAVAIALRQQIID